VFRRRRREEEQTPPAEQEPARPERESGPWDVEEAYPERERVDLGGLHLPVGPGFEVQLNVADDQIVGAVILMNESALQVGAFAAPKRSGIWDEVRADMKRELAGAGGSAEETEGPFGIELAAQVKQQGGTGTQQVRFVGVDGPRWFLRAVISGKAAVLDDDAAKAAAKMLEDVIRDIVVVRGDQPMAPKEPIELRLPPEARQAMEQQTAQEEPDLNPFERGPEITETR